MDLEAGRIDHDDARVAQCKQRPAIGREGGPTDPRALCLGLSDQACHQAVARIEGELGRAPNAREARRRDGGNPAARAIDGVEHRPGTVDGERPVELLFHVRSALCR